MTLPDTFEQGAQPLPPAPPRPPAPNPVPDAGDEGGSDHGGGGGGFTVTPTGNGGYKLGVSHGNVTVTVNGTDHVFTPENGEPVSVPSADISSLIVDTTTLTGTGTILHGSTVTGTPSDGDRTFNVLTTGNNNITGGLGADTIYLGAGNDTIRVGGGTSTDLISDSPATGGWDVIHGFNLLADKIVLASGKNVLADAATSEIGGVELGVSGGVASIVDSTAGLPDIVQALAGHMVQQQAVAFEYDGSTYVFQSNGIAGLTDSDVLIQLSGTTGLTDLGSILG